MPVKASSPDQKASRNAAADALFRRRGWLTPSGNHRVPLNQGAVQDAGLGVIYRGPRMHRAAIVPHQQVTVLPIIVRPH